ncbi:hypothetical protein DCAR_0623880 [Daucus carota subsp. sativus]|uniref:Uncharacterized protein n=1 Tax=Daucus carota subsp. sativus TaxID=79200 RepID=A0AAF0XDT8_DAUCS|nr:PREDICTED: uncharacterized protein LOC108228162 isoform X1 [Daucus carota subsp. sativus]XP_017259157.1 PREDICTED: uncharacterized protein LOC108228162 isoform X1 [Daucus carota subsp. sativus]XP_017259158.1 PREDICTED: uncharacterized protein LOC108228162 isoform X1 [Daucus carota subsp. sativus]XP_017259159.1 PREDICTED: uncharacterized protein LOC108228162 isoform X1 [Daucus carota subsp. sativus]WOH04471.1 hypothetical protein DCAR_0623880 [Daucus carota subsp. sativus]
MLNAGDHIEELIAKREVTDEDRLLRCMAARIANNISITELHGAVRVLENYGRGTFMSQSVWEKIYLHASEEELFVDTFWWQLSPFRPYILELDYPPENPPAAVITDFIISM